MVGVGVVTVLSNIYKCDTHWHCDSGGGSAGLSSDAHYVSVQTDSGTVYIGTVGMLSTSLVPRASVVVGRKKGATFKQHCSVCEANKVTNSVQVIACLPALQRLNKFTFLREYKYASEWILQTFAAVMLYSGQTSNTLPFPSISAS